MALLGLLYIILHEFDVKAMETSDTGYVNYYEGNGPLIILSQHGGYLKPDNIPNRNYGCYDGQQCYYQSNNCSYNSFIYLCISDYKCIY